ncbi:hormonally up-regulated neu tumor-associated kinase homolog A-like isoform X2 [Sphaerodactylus townsendi]|uniref:hormonally up-regulated neu tumor-associated kinase homolog A-like isoform X2 n=1 Tax=Sphaerodactylus townsendi TaxID=933632 RepID=UPI00202632A8|nr:hormonally up-regulated neu tumor-associated kinase homolog A-like isoform X2 [Sphaerodactylus townsendi]
MTQESRKNFPHTKQVGNYLVGRMINKGSFAKVMEGLHVPTGEKVAIKVIDKKKAKQDPYVLKNMKREPRIHQMIKHPNIVQLYETLETENSFYMVMELCLGGDLMDRICEKKKLDEREVKKYTKQILSAVEHLHRLGIVHRDLKIENFLLDENNSIKIVDFGLSNIMKFDGLSQELLNTQCGSPAYAAPELLAHKKYGPKVDVWSIGVSVFAMLTGTLPFTVEPFNIKQLHMKMVNGEINPMPPDISTEAVHFIYSFLKPDPAKRPVIKEVMKDKWLNDGNIKKPVNSLAYKNRLCPDDLNPVVLSYMTETMEFNHSDVVNVLINNKPSSVMTVYYLLLKKLIRYQKEQWTMKVEQVAAENLKIYDSKAFPSVLNTETPYAIQEDEIAITLENQEILPEVSKFADRELVHFEPPKSPNKFCSCEPLNHTLLDPQENVKNVKDFPEAKKLYLSEKPPTALRNNPSYSMNDQVERSSVSCMNRQAPKSATENRIDSHQSPLAFQDTRVKHLLKTIDQNLPVPTWQHHEKDSSTLLVMETPQLLPRLRQVALRDTLTKKISWMGLSQQQSNGSLPFCTSGSRQSIFPLTQHQTLMVKSLKQSKEKPKEFFNSESVRRNFVQLKHPTKNMDRNLPILSLPYQPKSEKKSEMLRLDFT